MGQIKSFIALSLDGFIASVDGELDWIPQSVRAIPKSLFENASCLLVGANTYDYLFEHLDGQVYKTKPIYVVSHSDYNILPNSNISFLTEKPLDAIRRLKQHHEILVIGSAKLLTELIQLELLDEITICHIPFFVGKGIGFIGETFGSYWQLVKCQSNKGAIFATYNYKKKQDD